MAAEFNSDDRPDLAITDRGTSDITVLFGRGDGTFEDQGANPVGNDPMGEVTADLTGDGYQDIVTVNESSDDISVLMSNGDGTFRPAETFPAGEGPVAVVVGDFNGDGLPDLAVLDSGNSYTGAGAGVSILMGDGDGDARSGPGPGSATQRGLIRRRSWRETLRATACSIPGPITNPYSNEVSILLGNGLGGFFKPRTVLLGIQAVEPISLVTGDFTGNGVTDLAVLNEATNNVSILQGGRRG